MICSSTTGMRLAKPLCSRTSRVSSSIWDFITAWAISWLFSLFLAVDLQVTTTPISDKPPVISATTMASLTLTPPITECVAELRHPDIPPFQTLAAGRVAPFTARTFQTGIFVHYRPFVGKLILEVFSLTAKVHSIPCKAIDIFPCLQKPPRETLAGITGKVSPGKITPTAGAFLTIAQQKTLPS